MRSITANANQAGVLRFLNDETNWKKWWPDSSSANGNPQTVLELGGYRFKKANTRYNSFEIYIEKDKNSESSVLNTLPLGIDSIKIVWSITLPDAINPFSKINHYFKAKDLGKKLEIILAAMQKYIGSVKNIYGIEIKQEKMQIDFMVSIKKSFVQYPTTEDIYREMGQIRKYIAQVKATENDYPVLNISARDSTHFELVVAIPVDKLVPDSGIFTQRRMLKNGNLLAAEITGGKYAVDSALKQIDTYAHDHQYLNIALPFQSFLTDRMKITDTSKWVTRIGYPIL